MKAMSLLIILSASLLCGCAAKNSYISPIDRAKYVAGLREVSTDGRDDLRTCTMFANLAGELMRLRQEDVEVYMATIFEIQMMRNRYADIIYPLYPEESHHKIDFIINMISDLYEVLDYDISRTPAMEKGHITRVTNSYRDRQFDTCLVTTTFSRTFSTATGMWSEAINNYNENQHKVPEAMPEPTTPEKVNYRAEAIKAKAVDYTILLLRWYFRIP